MTHGPESAATMYDRPVCSVAAKVIVPVPLPGNNSSVQYACKTPIENGIPQIRISIEVAPIRNSQAAFPESAEGSEDAFSGAVKSTSASTRAVDVRVLLSPKSWSGMEGVDWKGLDVPSTGEEGPVAWVERVMSMSERLSRRGCWRETAAMMVRTSVYAFTTTSS
jgi:hypothetical protein